MSDTIIIKDIDVKWTELILNEIYADSDNPWISTADKSTAMFANNKLKSINYPFLHPTLYLKFMEAIRPFCQKYTRPGFKETLNFCKHTKDILNHSGIFGKMAVWKLEPGEEVEPHADLLEYHLYVNRWIYQLNLDSSNTDIIVDNKKLEMQPGWMFELDLPLVHSFINKSSETWYFLTFDAWKV